MDVTKHVLEVDSVQKKINGKIIISDVYLKCETTNIIGVLGRNGSGKSTLFKIIFGIVSGDFKFVRIDGVVLSKTRELLKHISYLPQDNFIPNSLSIKKTIALSVSKDKVKDFCADGMIESIINKKINQLSGGELRYLEIKLILYNPSKFVLLDEPYNGLSPIMIDKINELIIKNSILKGIVITDHNYENVITISNQLVLMKEGKIIHLKDKRELVAHGYLNSARI